MFLLTKVWVRMLEKTRFEGGMRRLPLGTELTLLREWGQAAFLSANRLKPLIQYLNSGADVYLMVFSPKSVLNFEQVTLSLGRVVLKFVKVHSWHYERNGS